MHCIENYNENYYVQSSQQLRRTADEKFKIEAESYIFRLLFVKKNSPRTRRTNTLEFREWIIENDLVNDD